MMTRRQAMIAALVVAGALAGARGVFPQADPHLSYSHLPFSNGYAPSIFSTDSSRMDGFADHLYRDYDGEAASTDLLWDTYWGLNVDGNGAWLGEVEETSAGYEPGTGIVRVERTFRGLNVEEFYFAPFGFDGPVLVMLARVTNATSAPVQASLYTLHNFHVGPGAPEAGFSSESIVWQDGQFRESGAATGHTLLYHPVGFPSHRRADFAAGAGNPYLHISDPALADSDGTGGAGDDAVAAFQWYLGTGGVFSAGATRWEGVIIAYGSHPDVGALTDQVVLWIDGRDARALLDDERGAWADWLAAPDAVLASAVTDAGRLAQARQSLVMMRMGQVREPNGSYGAPHGQIVASMPPGMWNITWPRDQAYAVAGLVEAGVLDEARWALEFVLNGQAGGYAAEVGVPDYLVSVCRYHGGGFEESDGDPATVGPNIEFDNFGLFLWSMGKYAEASGDTALVSDNADAVFGGVADVLVQLIEPATGLLRADSSIWERHWNGSQKHFAYSNIMAVRGLCSAARMAESIGRAGDAERYMLAARQIQEAVAASLVVDSGSFIAQSLEEIATGACVDAAVVEALAFDLFPAGGPVYDGTLQRFLDELWIDATSRGYKRNDDGDWYDEQEWVVVDLRIALASRAGGDGAHADALVDWVTAQSAANHGLIAELYGAADADYEGAVPMMGFGGGAYLLALLSDPAGESVRACLEGPLPEAEEPESLEEAGDDAAVEEAAQDVPDGSDLVDDGAQDGQDGDAPDDGVQEEGGGGSGGGCGCRMI
jgi:GH15 family glucan-1,4-alpha-glucosidase